MRKFILLLMLFMLSVGVTACGGTVQQSVEDRNRVLGQEGNGGDSNYQEALQIQKVEKWKDQVGKVVNVYLINTYTGLLLAPPIQCQGVPNSSTESLEPNTGVPYTSSSLGGWKVPIDGVDVITQEMAGRDGTYGDPVPFRYCLDVAGAYHDWPAEPGTVFPYITSNSYTFEPSTIQPDFEAAARIAMMEAILGRGGCVNPETLLEVKCDATPTPAPTPDATPTVVQ